MITESGGLILHANTIETLNFAREQNPDISQLLSMQILGKLAPLLSLKPFHVGHKRSQKINSPNGPFALLQIAYKQELSTMNVPVLTRLNLKHVT